MQPKVSVIVPIYNVEKYLPKCVTSILNQTLTDIEVILVNDGSTDGSGILADEHALEDHRIKVIHKKNGGLSDARNCGMNVAMGQYIAFVDSDDWIEDNMLEEMYQLGVDNNSDIVVSGIIFDYEKENYLVSKTAERLLIGKDLSSIKDATFLTCKLGLFNTVTNKLYKREFLVANEFKFTLVAMPAEDVIFNCQVFSLAPKVILDCQAYYHYMQRDIKTYVTTYSPKIYKVSLARYNNLKDMFQSLSLEENEHISWLNDVYINGLYDCVTNMYRRGSTMSFKKRYCFLRDMILKDSPGRSFIQNFIPPDLYRRIFKLLFVINSTFIMIMVYEFLFFCRKNFNKVYVRFRRRSLYGC